MKKFITSSLILLAGVFSYTTIFAYPIGDPDDIFYVNTPTPNQKVNGTVNITWRMWDDDQSSIQYTAKLYDGATCQNINYGVINANLSGTSNLNQDNSLAWNTNNTQTSTNLPDGNYCLQICAAMKNGGASYSACNSRIVKIVNHNTLPTITSNPSITSIKESDSWSYQVTAFDADNDPLVYSLVYSTNFLEINSQTGLIKTNGNSKALPNGVNQINYKIVVSVNDNLSGSKTQEFTLSVTRDNPVVVPPSTTPPPAPPSQTPENEEPEEVPEEEDVNKPANIEVNYPTDGAILRGDNNEVEWEITEEDGLKRIILEYSQNQEDGWQNIKTIQNAQELALSSYTWDVSNISDGTYFLRIKVLDQKDVETNRISDNFIIKNQIDEAQSQPLIINLSPESNTEIQSTTPELSAEFVPSGSSKVLTETIKVILNDVDITEQCTTSENGFSCNLDQPLDDGKHSINVSYEDSDGKVAGLNWTFTVNTNPEDQVLNQDSVIILGREIPRNSLIILAGLIVLFGLLLIIPWVLYRNWKRSQLIKLGQSGWGDNYTPLTPEPSQPAFSPIGETPQIPSEKFETKEPAVQSLTQPKSQKEIEKSLNKYWTDKGESPIEYVEPTPIEPEDK